MTALIQVTTVAFECRSSRTTWCRLPQGPVGVIVSAAVLPVSADKPNGVSISEPLYPLRQRALVYQTGVHTPTGSGGVRGVC
jgi:hypothetical protein